MEECEMTEFYCTKNDDNSTDLEIFWGKDNNILTLNLTPKELSRLAQAVNGVIEEYSGYNKLFGKVSEEAEE